MRLTPALALSTLSLAAADITLLKGSIERLRSGKAQASDVAPEAAVRRTLKGDLTIAFPWEHKLLASEWFLRAHMVARQQPAPLPAPDSPDLRRAWELVSQAKRQAYGVSVSTAALPASAARASSSALGRLEASRAVSDAITTQQVDTAKAEALDWVALETAVRLQDAALMQAALDPVLVRKQLGARDLTLAFLAAGHTGRWAEFRDLAAALRGAPKVWDTLRSLARQDAAFFPYEEALALVPESEAAKAPLLDRAAFTVKDMRLSFKEATCADPAMVEKARAAFAAGISTGPLDAPFTRVGSLAQWRKPGAAVLPMAGPAERDHLRIGGVSETSAAGTRLRRTETLDLTRDPAAPARWTGTQTTRQEVVEGQAPASTTYTLVLGVELEAEAPKS